MRGYYKCGESLHPPQEETHLFPKKASEVGGGWVSEEVPASNSVGGSSWFRDVASESSLKSRTGSIFKLVCRAIRCGFKTPKMDYALKVYKDKAFYQLGFQVCWPWKYRITCHLKRTSTQVTDRLLFGTTALPCRPSFSTHALHLLQKFTNNSSLKLRGVCLLWRPLVW